jgi:hypothetical protein
LQVCSSFPGVKVITSEVDDALEPGFRVVPGWVVDKSRHFNDDRGHAGCVHWWHSRFTLVYVVAGAVTLATGTSVTDAKTPAPEPTPTVDIQAGMAWLTPGQMKKEHQCLTNEL